MIISYPYFGVDTICSWVRYSHAQYQFDTEFDFLKLWIAEFGLTDQPVCALGPHRPAEPSVRGRWRRLGGLKEKRV